LVAVLEMRMNALVQVKDLILHLNFEVCMISHILCQIWTGEEPIGEPTLSGIYRSGHEERAWTS